MGSIAGCEGARDGPGERGNWQMECGPERGAKRQMPWRGVPVYRGVRWGAGESQGLGCQAEPAVPSGLSID